MRTELDGGGWVDHRPHDDLKGKDKKALTIFLRRRLPVSGDGQLDPRGLDPGQREELEGVLREAAWARVIDGWSFGLPVPQWEDNEPVNLDSFGELPLAAYNQVEALLAPAYAALIRQPDPKGLPTEISSSSNGRSRARATGSRTA